MKKQKQEGKYIHASDVATSNEESHVATSKEKTHMKRSY